MRTDLFPSDSTRYQLRLRSQFSLFDRKMAYGCFVESKEPMDKTLLEIENNHLNACIIVRTLG